MRTLPVKRLVYKVDEIILAFKNRSFDLKTFTPQYRTFTRICKDFSNNDPVYLPTLAAIFHDDSSIEYSNFSRGDNKAKNYLQYNECTVDDDSYR